MRSDYATVFGFSRRKRYKQLRKATMAGLTDKSKTSERHDDDDAGAEDGHKESKAEASAGCASPSKVAGKE